MLVSHEARRTAGFRLPAWAAGIVGLHALASPFAVLWFSSAALVTRTYTFWPEQVPVVGAFSLR